MISIAAQASRGWTLAAMIRFSIACVLAFVWRDVADICFIQNVVEGNKHNEIQSSSTGSKTRYRSREVRAFLEPATG